MLIFSHAEIESILSTLLFYKITFTNSRVHAVATAGEVVSTVNSTALVGLVEAAGSIYITVGKTNVSQTGSPFPIIGHGRDRSEPYYEVSGSGVSLSEQQIS